MSFPMAGPHGKLEKGTLHARLPLSRGFSLTELLAAIAIMAVLTVLAIPAFTSMASAGSMTSASYAISGAIQTARSYAMAHDTYTWLGFFEEDGNAGSTNPATAGTGRVILSMVASTDGTMTYSSSATAPITLSPTRLIQIRNLMRVPYVHLKSFTNGAGGGTTFATRPPLSSANARIGDTTVPVSSALPSFQYPVGSASPAQYTFTKVLQFSPRGEVLDSAMSGVMTPLIEVGLQPVRGDVVTNSQNFVALQIAGISGNVILYRQ
jgi:prepilin-type N-terminal cleavage/methylation domain-containing protein